MRQRLFSLVLILVVKASICLVTTPPCLPRKIGKQYSFQLQAKNNLNEDDGGYTVKQRLREEIDSPFRKVRLVLFGFSTISATVALYFSLLTIGKSAANFADAPPMQIATRDFGINIASVAVCGALTYREVIAGEKNLERIAKGGQLASLRVRPADGAPQISLSKYRNKFRLVIAAGGEDFISKLAVSLLDVDRALSQVSVRIIPILIDESGRVDVDRGTILWRQAQKEKDTTVSNSIVDFPVLSTPWTEYLNSEIATAKSQGFNVLQSGIGIYIKKNGRVLRRATGLPNWDQFIGTMDVMDGNQFGRPRF
uniref:Uncharacterized protein n=1 Tax=Aureoumbra lagunensis TaxID=44058 RepID=A0A7S3K3R9_9STRA|mmetsp:Transcript_1771/g.2349  ORF Transcript_1771/g.2349 Transcript_1771/m.2349 type:complete len:311 (+) Transcript_1771:70-1002(+)